MLMFVIIGDSRSVLGKDGKTIPMSFDHKPMNVRASDLFSAGRYSAATY